MSPWQTAEPLTSLSRPHAAKMFRLSRGGVLVKLLPEGSLKVTGCSSIYHRAVCKQASA